MQKVNIKEYLKSLPNDEPIYYFPNPGNAGDSLIAYATFQVFDKIGIKYKVLHKNDTNLQNKILIYSGGGNLTTFYKKAREFIEKNHEFARKLVILPHTIFGHEDLLSHLGNNVDIITREEISYEYVKSRVQNPKNVYLTDDMVFELDVRTLFDQFSVLLSLWLTSTIPSRQVHKGNLFEFQQYVKKILLVDNLSCLNSFRTDIEKTDFILPSNNIDIARKFEYGTTKKRAMYASYRMLKFIDRYDTIRTNRLHTCIAGAIMNKNVEFYPNNTYKCKAVYQYSIEKKFPKVKWMG